MSLIIDTPRNDVDGDSVLQYTNVANIAPETFTFNKTYNKLLVRNGSSSVLTLIVNGLPLTIKAYDKVSYKGDYTSIILSASTNSCEFIVLATEDTVSDGISQAQSAVFSVKQKPLKIFSSDFEETYQGSGILKDWVNTSTGTGAISVAASTRQDGGNTLTLIDADAAGLAMIKSKAFHGYATAPQWFTTDEITLATNQTVNFEIQALDNSRRGTILVNSAGAGTIQINATDGIGILTVPNVTTAIGFVSTTAFRLGMWYDPSNGKVKFYLFCGSSTGLRHIYMGEKTNTAVPRPIAFIQFNTGQGSQGSVTAARVRGYEVRGIIHGCSVDAPHNAFAMAPGYFPLQSHFNNSAEALALRLWGQSEGILNVAHGSWTVENYENGALSANGEDTATWVNMVTSLKPKFVVIGSGINSVSAAATKSPPSTAATNALEASKACYIRLIDASFNAGVQFVACRNCSPVGGHVSFVTSAQLDMVDNWNTWMDTLPALYPNKLAIIDVWSVMVDPSIPRTSLPMYDCGDHIHYSVDGGENLANADAKAILSLI